MKRRIIKNFFPGAVPYTGGDLDFLERAEAKAAAGKPNPYQMRVTAGQAMAEIARYRNCEDSYELCRQLTIEALVEGGAADVLDLALDLSSRNELRTDQASYQLMA